MNDSACRMYEHMAPNTAMFSSVVPICGRCSAERKYTIVMMRSADHRAR